MEEKSRKIAGILGEPDEIERKDSIDSLFKKLNQYFGTDPGDLRQTGDQGGQAADSVLLHHSCAERPALCVN